MCINATAALYSKLYSIGMTLVIWSLLLFTLSKLYDVPVVFVPLPILRLRIALFAVAEGWLLLDIG